MPHAWKAPTNHENSSCIRVRVKVRRPVWAKARVMGKDFKPHDLTNNKTGILALTLTLELLLSN